MNELFLAFFIFVTIFIDTLAISLKAVGTKKQLAMVYAVTQALTYITRFSLFFILPVIGLILDSIISFNIFLFLGVFIILLVFHAIFFLYKYNAVINNYRPLVYLFNKNLYLFYKYLFTRLFRGRRRTLARGDVRIIYFASHVFLALLFPLVIILGKSFEEYRAMIMGGTSVYTGLFSIYITFFVERKIPYLEDVERQSYIARLVITKIYSTLFSACAFLVFIALYLIRPVQ